MQYIWGDFCPVLIEVPESERDWYRDLHPSTRCIICGGIVPLSGYGYKFIDISPRGCQVFLSDNALLSFHLEILNGESAELHPLYNDSHVCGKRCNLLWEYMRRDTTKNPKVPYRVPRGLPHYGSEEKKILLSIAFLDFAARNRQAHERISRK